MISVSLYNLPVSVFSAAGNTAHDVGGGLTVAIAAAGVSSFMVVAAAGLPFFVVVVVALEVSTKSKASGQRLSQLFAESIEVVLGDCTFTQ